MDATSTPFNDEDERRARHLSVCQELIDLGLKLARAAAQRALDSAGAEPGERATKRSKASATSSEPADEQNAARAPDPALAFTRLSRCLQQSVTLEARIAADAFRAPASRAPVSRKAAEASANTARFDAETLELVHVVNRVAVSDGLHRLTEDHPDRWSLYYTIEETVEKSLADYPDDPLCTHFARTCAIFGLTPNLTGFPDHLIECLSPAPLSAAASTSDSPDG